MQALQALQYLDHQVTPCIICSICLEVVAADAVKISCHEGISCSECIAHWISSQLVRQVPTTCPHCRARVDASNLKAVHGTSKWSESDEHFYDSFDGDFYDEDDTLEERVEAEVDGHDVPAMNRSGMVAYDFTSKVMENDREADNESYEIAIDKGDEMAKEVTLNPVEIHYAAEGEMVIDGEEKIAKESIQESDEAALEESEEKGFESSDSSKADDDEVFIGNQDDGTPEGFMRDNRYRNIVARRPSFNTQSLLFASQPPLPNPYGFDYQPQAWNTIFASNLLPSTAFVIIAEHGQDPQPVEYYYIFVIKITTIRELTRLWSVMTVGEEFNGMDAPAGFKFQNRVMGLDETVEEVGMVHGSSFTIPAAFGGVSMN